MLFHYAWWYFCLFWQHICRENEDHQSQCRCTSNTILLPCIQCLKHIAIVSQNNITEVRSALIQLQHIQLSNSFIRFNSLLLKFDPISQCHSPPLVSNNIEILDLKDMWKIILKFWFQLTILVDHICILMVLLAIAQILSKLVSQLVACKIMLPNSFT